MLSQSGTAGTLYWVAFGVADNGWKRRSSFRLVMRQTGHYSIPRGAAAYDVVKYQTDWYNFCRSWWCRKIQVVLYPGHLRILLVPYPCDPSASFMMGPTGPAGDAGATGPIGATGVGVPGNPAIPYMPFGLNVMEGLFEMPANQIKFQQFIAPATATYTSAELCTYRVDGGGTNWTGYVGAAIYFDNGDANNSFPSGYIVAEGSTSFTGAKYEPTIY